MGQWDYKSFNDKLNEEDLKMLGQQGWELVSHTAIMMYGSMIQYYIFKRELVLAAPYDDIDKRELNQG